MKNRKINLQFHLFVLALAIVLNRPHVLNIGSVVYYIVALVFPLGIFYTCYYWLVPDYLAKKKILNFIVLLLILLNLMPLIGYFTLEMVHDVMAGTTIHLFYKWNMHFSGMFVLTVAAIFGIAFRSLKGWHEEMDKNSLLEGKKA